MKQEFGDSVAVDVVDVGDERRISDDDLTTRQRPRGDIAIRLKEYTGQGLLSYDEERTYQTNELPDAIYPTDRQPWVLSDTLYTIVTVLMTVYDQELLMEELRKLTGQSTKRFPALKYREQEHTPVDALPVSQPPQFFDGYTLASGSKAKHEGIGVMLFREIRKIAETQLRGGLGGVMVRGEWESLFERVSPGLPSLALAIGVMQTADKLHSRSLNA